MAAEVPGERLGRVFQQRLNALVDRSARQGAPVSNAEMARWMTEHGFPITPPALSMLRNRPGARPALRTIEGLAAFFEVDPAVLLSDQDVRPALAELHADPAAEAVAARAAGLSPGSLAAVRALLDQLRANEGLAPVSG
ncbi:MAG TPA: hypothetical protein VGC67_17780 [Cellulomonas sp.]